MRITARLATLILMIWCGVYQPVLAQETNRTTRERELEQKVQELSQRVSELEKLVRESLLARRETRSPAQEERTEESRTLPGQGVESERPVENASDAPQTATELTQRMDNLEKRLDESAQTNAWRVSWRNGFRFDSPDQAFQLRIGGRIMNDWAFFAPDEGIKNAFGSLEDGTEFRRSRLFVSGTVYDHVEFKAEYDFAGGASEFKDVYLGLVELPVIGNFRAGHFKAPFSLEQMTSSRYITFMERSPRTAFAPDRNAGLMFFNDAIDERLTWAVGVFRNTDEFGDGSGDDSYHVTGRLTGLPWYEEEGRKFLHLGMAFSHRNPAGNVVRFRERPEAHLAPRFVDTGTLAARSFDLLGLEGALVVGPASLQSEYTQSFVNTPTGADPRFSSFYVQGSYFLTGEHRVYNRSDAIFDRVSPKRNFDPGRQRGFGAWEIAARYSFLDLNDKGVQGGKLQDVTTALNWYLTPNTRFIWNYVFADREDVGNANIFQMRFQIDF